MDRSLFLVLALGLSQPAWAEDDEKATPYTEVRDNIGHMDDMIRQLDKIIEKRGKRGHGRSMACLTEHRDAIDSLRGLAHAERARLVDALAEGRTEEVQQASVNVSLWTIKARVHVEAVGQCPDERDDEALKEDGD